MNRTALVTGGSRGIGRGVVLALARAGFDVAVNYAGNREAAEQTRQEAQRLASENSMSIRTEIHQADIGRAEDRAALVDFVQERFGRLDLLVNNAGITSIGRADLLELTEANFDRLMAVNLKGPFFLSQSCAGWMRDQLARNPDLDPPPMIVNISSLSAYAVSTNRADYCMAKAALSMMTRLYAVRLAEFGVRVYEIRPGIVESDMTAGVKEKYDRLIEEGLTPIRRWGRPEDVARAVAALAEGAFPFSTGEAINVDGGFHIRTL